MGTWLDSHRQIGSPVDDVVVEAAEPALLIAGGSGFEGCEIAVPRHARSFAGRIAQVGPMTLEPLRAPNPKVGGRSYRHRYESTTTLNCGRLSGLRELRGSIPTVCASRSENVDPAQAALSSSSHITALTRATPDSDGANAVSGPALNLRPASVPLRDQGNCIGMPCPCLCDAWLDRRIERETAAYGPLTSAPPCICCVRKG